MPKGRRKEKKMTTKNDAVNPQHYRNSEGVQLIEVIRWLPFSLGNAIKYTYRNAHKENARQDLEKALWYLSDFSQNPTVVAAASEKVTPEIWDAVFQGVEPFERECCEKLYHLHELALEGKGLTSAAQEAKAMVQEAIQRVS